MAICKGISIFEISEHLYELLLIKENEHVRILGSEFT